jgi:hypothetical protein
MDGISYQGRTLEISFSLNMLDAKSVQEISHGRQTYQETVKYFVKLLTVLTVGRGDVAKLRTAQFQ